jgi:hypothetical protein
MQEIISRRPACRLPAGRQGRQVYAEVSADFRRVFDCTTMNDLSLFVKIIIIIFVNCKYEYLVCIVHKIMKKI